MVDRSDRKFFYVFFICVLGLLEFNILKSLHNKLHPITGIVPSVAIIIIVVGCVVGWFALNRYQEALGRIGLRIRLVGIVLLFFSRIINLFLQGGSVVSTHVVVGICALAAIICTAVLLLIEDYQ